MDGRSNALSGGGAESFTAIYEKEVAAQPEAWSSRNLDAPVKLCIAFQDINTYNPVLLNPGETKNLSTNIGVVAVTLNKTGDRVTVNNQLSAFVSVLFLGVD